MNHSGDAAEQIVRMSLEGVEVIAKITGAAAKNIAAFLLAALKDNGDGEREHQKLKGKDRLENMLKSGKPLEIFTVRNDDLKTFAEGAKQYGIVYCVLRDKKRSPDGLCDIMVRAEDAPKINRLVERFKLANVEKSAELASEAPTAETERTAEVGGAAIDGEGIGAVDGTGEVEINDIDALMADLMGTEDGLDAATAEIGKEISAGDFDLSTGAVVHVDGVEYKVHSTDAERVLFEEVSDPLKTREINRAELETKLRDDPLNDGVIKSEPTSETPIETPTETAKAAEEIEEPAPEHSSKTRGGRRAKERGGKDKNAPARDDNPKDAPAVEERPRPDAAKTAKSRPSEPALTSADKPARATSKPSVSRELGAITAKHKKREADKRREENDLERGDGDAAKKRTRNTPTTPTHTPPKKAVKGAAENIKPQSSANVKTSQNVTPFAMRSESVCRRQRRKSATNRGECDTRESPHTPRVNRGRKNSRQGAFVRVTS